METKRPEETLKQLHSSVTLKLPWLLFALKNPVPPGAQIHTEVHAFAPAPLSPVSASFLVTVTFWGHRLTPALPVDRRLVSAAGGGPQC